MESYKYVVGIDLGTTNTLACWRNRGKLELIKVMGGIMLPSVLYVDERGKQYVGKQAKKRGEADPDNMIRSSKTKMGKPREEATWVCNGKSYTPTDVATEILGEMRQNIIKQGKLPENAEIGAVITVPAYFSGNQKEETEKAGRAAGFKVMRIITEPMAAAIAAITDMELLDRKVLVLDLGGGTFDLCVLQADKVSKEYKALATGGDRELGGDDFDMLFSDWLLWLIQQDTGRDLSSHVSAGMKESEFNSFLARVRELAELVKIDLSDTSETKLDAPEFLPGYDLAIKISRDEFNRQCQPLFDRVFGLTRDFLDANTDKFRKEDIGEIILAGGSCHMPYITEELGRIFGWTPREGLDKSRLVVTGAAIVAEWLNSGMETRVEEILSHSLGVAAYTQDGRELFSKLLHKSTPYPVTRKEIFTTAADSQQDIVVKIYEAGHLREDSENLDDHEFYGSMVLEGIEVAPRGIPQIEVAFDYDSNGCLTVNARDLKTGAQQSLTLHKGEHLEKPGGRAAPMDIMLLLDCSGSMSGIEMREAKKASHFLINDLIDFSSHQMGLVSFTSSAVLRSPLTRDKSFLNQEVDKLDANGGTDFAHALRKARDNMPDNGRKRVVILVTDGEDPDTRAYKNLAQDMHASGFRIIAIGAGSNARTEYLRLLVNDPKDVYSINSMAELTSTFEKVINGLALKN